MPVKPSSNLHNTSQRAASHLVAGSSVYCERGIVSRRVVLRRDAKNRRSSIPASLCVATLKYVELCTVNCVHVSSTMKVEKLIEAVRYFPCLWDVTKTCYKDARAKKNAWKEVVIQVRNILANSLASLMPVLLLMIIIFILDNQLAAMTSVLL